MFDIQLIEQVVASIFPRSSPIAVERVEEGVSTCVYKIRYGGEIFYPRVLPEEDASFAPEALVHQLLRARQVKVPEVLHFEHSSEALQRSILLTTEIKGTPLGEIRGANALYDLGHFRMHDGETLPISVLPYLIEGYRGVASLPADYERNIYLSSLLIAIRALARSVQKRRDIRIHQGLKAIRRDLQTIWFMK